MEEKECNLGVDDAAQALARTQVFTPGDLAIFMANLLGVQDGGSEPLELLDPAAGAGALADAVAEVTSRPLTVTLVERDTVFGPHLKELVETQSAAFLPESAVLLRDFLALAPEWIENGKRFSNIVMNPPYARVAPGSDSASLLRAQGVHAHNLFAAFIWLATDLLAEGGRLVAIVPRSFLSGLHYAATRAHVFENAGLYALHHFTDRRAVFARDSVQQEVVIFGAIRGHSPDFVQFSQSTALVDNPQLVLLPKDRLVLSAAEKHVVLVPDLVRGVDLKDQPNAPLLPADVTVSVGSVVDFRAKEDVVARDVCDVPLIGSEAFYSRPVAGRGLRASPRSVPHIFPPGRYVIIRRISPAEARPRIQAQLVEAIGDDFMNGVAFENHLLVLHAGKKGLSMSTCTVLLERLSDARTEQQFMERGGTTQVNVGDIRSLRYAT